MTEENQQADNNDTGDQSKISTFTIDLSQGLQRRIRLAATQNGLSISEYVERVLDKECEIRGVYATPYPHFSYQVASHYDTRSSGTYP